MHMTATVGGILRGVAAEGSFVGGAEAQGKWSLNAPIDKNDDLQAK